MITPVFLTLDGAAFVTPCAVKVRLWVDAFRKTFECGTNLGISGAMPGISGAMPGISGATGHAIPGTPSTSKRLVAACVHW